MPLTVGPQVCYSSHLIIKHGYIAHLVEHYTFNVGVEGSSPSVPTKYAVCPGGEEAALKAVGLKGLAGSNPVDGAIEGKL